MPDLVVIPLAEGFMSDNLARAMAVDGRKPWAFNKFISNMKGVRPGVHLAFMRMTRPGGSPIGKQGAYPSDAVVHRIVLGTIVAPVVENVTPFFEGFPQEFWWELIADIRPEAPIDLAVACETFNERLPGLGLRADQLLPLLSNARSAKVGMYFDGEPRKADYFATKPSPTPATAVPAPTSAVATVPKIASSRDPLLDAVDHFVSAVEESHLVFTGINEQLPRAFLSGLLAKRFVLLTGLAGSGKTQLARAFGQWLGADAQGRRYLVVPVRADWTTPEPLLGYEDALLPPSVTGRRAWSVPPALQFMLRAAHDRTRSYALVLDEMNLAHVERYFADVLSGMESGEAILPNLSPDSRGYWYPREGEPVLVPLPSNLFLIGTVNIDETTYQFSPKVLDRSFSFEFRVSTAELDGALRGLKGAPAATDAHLAATSEVANDSDWHLDHPSPVQGELEEFLTDLHEQLSPVGLEFGHRSYREALRMAAILSASGIEDAEEIIDWVVMTKVLPRVHGSRRQLEAFLRSLQSTANGSEPGKPDFPLMARKVTRMLDSLLANQYVGFAE